MKNSVTRAFRRLAHGEPQPCDSRRSPRARLFSKCSSTDVSSSPAALIILRNAGLRSPCARRNEASRSLRAPGTRVPQLPSPPLGTHLHFCVSPRSRLLAMARFVGYHVLMSKMIETTYRNGCIQLPDDVHIPEDTRVTVILPDNAPQQSTPDSAYSIPDLASDIGPEDLARNLEHYLYGQSKQS